MVAVWALAGCVSMSESSQRDLAQQKDCLEDNEILIIAHRGGRELLLPENSIEIVLGVARMAPIGVEIDVMQSSDGVWFLHHDQTLERTTTGLGRARDKKWEDLASLQLRDRQGMVTQSQVPRLSNVLSVVASDTPFVFDAKPPINIQGLSEQVATYREGSVNYFVVYSLRDAIEVQKAPATIAILAFPLNPAASRGLDLERTMVFYGTRAEPGNTKLIALAAQGEGETSIDQMLLNSADPREVEARVRRSGASLVFTDYPRSMADALFQRGDSQCDLQIGNMKQYRRP